MLGIGRSTLTPFLRLMARSQKNRSSGAITPALGQGGAQSDAPLARRKKARSMAGLGVMAMADQVLRHICTPGASAAQRASNASTLSPSCRAMAGPGG